ncbi:MAG: ParB/RepB/Spo0J family partition protein, partial [Pseudohongiellaceae bacterium]
MTTKKKLGRGLDALLSNSNSEKMSTLLRGRPISHPGAPVAEPKIELDPRPESLTPTDNKVSLSSLVTTDDKDGEMRHLPLDLIQPGKYQPRTDMHEAALEELANSIRQQGVMQPIVVRPISSTRYEIVAGERRWRASQLAELHTIPAIIKHVSDESAIAMSLIENIQRENLNPIEEAVALKRLQDEFHLTQQEVADAVGKSRASVTNLIRLIGLSHDVRKMLEHGDLEMGHARAMLSLPDMQQS